MTAMSAATEAAQPEPGRARSMTPARAIRHAMTLAWRSTVRIRRNPEQLLDVTLQPIIFVTLFVFLFGGAIKGGDRHTYLEYVLPGITVMTVVFASMGTGIGLNTDVTKGIFDRFKSLPIARSAPLLAASMGEDQPGDGADQRHPQPGARRPDRDVGVAFDLVDDRHHGRVRPDRRAPVPPDRLVSRPAPGPAPA